MGLFQQPKEAPAWTAFFEFALQWEKEKSATGLLGEFLEYFAYFEEAGGTINLPDEEAPARDSDSPGGALPEIPVQRLLWGEQQDVYGKVQLMTMHSAKGLEFDRVFLLHLLRGALPSRRRPPLISFPDSLVKGPPPKPDVHIEEERRLFYVALTRAKNALTLCTVANSKQQPSPFLEELRDSKCADLEWKQVAPCGAPAAVEISGTEVEPGKFSSDLVLSASGLETYRSCPLKYYYSYVIQIPGAPSAALRFGSIMHGALKQVVGRLAFQPETLQDGIIEAILREYWAEAFFADPVQERKYWAMGLEQLAGIRRTLSEKPFQLHSQEKTFEFSRGGIKVLGRIDQINRLAGKRVELIEYKTGRAQTQKDADSSLQLTLYALACREVLDLEPVEMVLYNLETQERLRTKRDPEDFRDLEELLRETSSKISAQRFLPDPGYHCRFCDFRPLCPAHDEVS